MSTAGAAVEPGFQRRNLRLVRRVRSTAQDSPKNGGMPGVAVRGREESTLPVEVTGLVIVCLLLQTIRFHAESGFRNSVLVLLRQVELSMLLKTRARVRTLQLWQIN